jgi:opacity protein-like surface antigen
MKAFVICAALATLAAAPAFAEDLVARQGDDSVRLSDAACKSELVLSRIEPGMATEFRAASAMFQGQRFQACWRMMGNAAYLMYEDGDQGVIPANELKPDLTA